MVNTLPVSGAPDRLSPIVIFAQLAASHIIAVSLSAVAVILNMLLTPKPSPPVTLKSALPLVFVLTSPPSIEIAEPFICSTEITALLMVPLTTVPDISADVVSITLGTS